jgi:flagellar hook assembly protein FlgD
MAKLRRSGSVIGMMIGLLVLVATLAFAQTAGFQVTSVTPGTIDPAKGQYARITYTVPTTASFNVSITNSAGTSVRNLGTYSNVPASTRYTYWNGRDAYSRILPNGTYAVMIQGKAADGSALATGRGTVIVGAATTTPPPPPTTSRVITVTSVTNSTFDPSAGQTTTVNYTVPVALTTLTNSVVNSAGSTVRTLGTYPNVAARSYIAPWNGKSSSGTIVPDGAYTIKLTGKDSTGATVAGSATVTVKSGTTTPPPPPPTTSAFQITGVNPATIDPSKSETTTITYTVPVTADLRVFVRNSSGTEVRVIGTYTGVAASSRTATWDGKNSSGQTVANGTYAVAVDGKVAGTSTVITPAASNVAVSVGAVTPPPPPPPTTGGAQEFGYPVESKTAYNWEGWRYGDMKNKYAAAFTAQKNGTVSRLACEWKTQGSYGAGNYGYYDLQVVPSDAHGLPDMTKVLATEANFHPLNGGQPRDGWQLFNSLDHSFNVTAGQRYWMVISPRTVSSSNYSCPNAGSGRAVKFVDTQLMGMDGYVVASYNYFGANAWRGWISGDGGFPASWKSGASNTTHATQRGAIGIFYSDGSAQGQAGYWGSGGSGSGYDRIYNGMSIGEQIYWNRANVSINRVGFFVGKVGSPSAGLNWAIKNVTTGATLASGTIAASSVLSEANQNNITLSQPISLVRGQMYRISLSSSTSSSAAYRFWGACYDQGTATTDAIRYAAFTGGSISQTTLQYSTDGSNWVNGGNGRGGYAFDMPFSLWGSYQ